MKNINLLLIGLGAHAMRIYYPIIQKSLATEDVHIVCVVDLEEKKDAILNYFSDNMPHPDKVCLLSREDVDLNELKPHIKTLLDNIIAQYNISGVIISTEPLAHMVYAKWALREGLSVLIDKPISARENLSNSLAQAKGLVDDYADLAGLYQKAQLLNPKCVFSVMTQRRFHPAFIKVKELISEVFNRTGCPVTSIITEHADGEWRMPEEVVYRNYHPYNQGYGIFCHSGYHSLDTILWLMEAGYDECKNIDNVDVFANFLKPKDYIQQITMDELIALFGYDNFKQFNSLSQEFFIENVKNFGEIDAFASFKFKRQDTTMALVNVNMIHNGFSQRGWITSQGRNLYIGNGRVRHETYYIQQGPFQAIKLMSFQSKEFDPENTDSLFDIGGEYHLDIHVFRNSNMFPDWKSITTMKLNDLMPHIAIKDGSRGHQEEAKRHGIVEFISMNRGKISRENLKSDLMSHKNSVQLLSGIYQSAILRDLDQNPVINMQLDKSARPKTKQ